MIKNKKDLNNCTVLYFFKGKAKQQRAVRQFVGVLLDDSNTTEINYCTTEPLRTNTTKDSLAEWLRDWASIKSINQNPFYHLKSGMSEMPADISQAFDNLMQEIENKGFNEFLTKERIAGILLTGQKPVLKVIKIQSRNFGTIYIDIQ